MFATKQFKNKFVAGIIAKKFVGLGVQIGDNRSQGKLRYANRFSPKFMRYCHIVKTDAGTYAIDFVCCGGEPEEYILVQMFNNWLTSRETAEWLASDPRISKRMGKQNAHSKNLAKLASEQEELFTEPVEFKLLLERFTDFVNKIEPKE